MKALMLLLVLMVPAWAEDWTVNGKSYQNVTVQGSDDSTVSIMYDGGIGRVNLSDLTPELQKRFGYDPQKAKAADKAEAARLAALDQQHLQEVQQQAKANAQPSTPPAPASPTTYSPPPAISRQVAAPAPSGLTSEQRAAIQSQISALQADISFMQGEEAKVIQEGNKQAVKRDGRTTSQGAYQDKIISEQAQLNQLQAELK